MTEKMAEKTYEQWIGELASSAQTPGGGAACALVGAVGAALGSMVGNLTVGKKKFAEVESEMQSLLAETAELTQKLESMIEGDAAAFEPLAAAYRMPADTDEAKAKKEEAIQAALGVAIWSPLAIAECCCKALALLEVYAKKGNPLLRSDAGVGAACCRAALEGAKLNILTNLRLVKDAEARDDIFRSVESITANGVKAAERIYRFVEQDMMWETDKDQN